MFDSDPQTSIQKRPVRIVVHDKSKHESRTFSCDAFLLRSSMTYFATVLDQLLEVADRSSSTPLSLNVNCDIAIFSWLMDYIQNRGPAMLPTNVVSLILSSNFLMMEKLFVEGLEYLRTHLVDVLLTDVNMDCIPPETVVKLAGTMTEDDVAGSLLGIVESGNERCPNRSFISVLLKHVVQQRVCDDPVSLRWCHRCGTLVDAEVMKAVNACSMHEVPCPMLGAGRVGSRGEVLKTHEATIAVADNFMTTLINQVNASSSNATGVLVGGSVGTSSGPSLTSPTSSSAGSPTFQQITGGDASEAVNWRLIGSCKVYRCENCDAAVQLVAARQHDCTAPPQRPTSPSSAPLAQQSAHILERYFSKSAAQRSEERLVRLFLTVLPPMPPIRRLNPPTNALSATLSASSSAPMSPYVDISLQEEMQNPQVTAMGPILWKKGALHTVQGVQADGTPNTEIMRFHETKMMAHLISFVNSFAAQPTPQPSRAAVKSSSGLQRAGTFSGVKGKLGSSVNSSSGSLRNSVARGGRRSISSGQSK